MQTPTFLEDWAPSNGLGHVVTALLDVVPGELEAHLGKDLLHLWVLPLDCHLLRAHLSETACCFHVEAFQLGRMSGRKDPTLTAVEQDGRNHRAAKHPGDGGGDALIDNDCGKLSPITRVS